MTANKKKEVNFSSTKYYYILPCCLHKTQKLITHLNEGGRGSEEICAGVYLQIARKYILRIQILLFNGLIWMVKPFMWDFLFSIDDFPTKLLHFSIMLIISALKTIEINNRKLNSNLNYRIFACLILHIFKN